MTVQSETVQRGDRGVTGYWSRGILSQLLARSQSLRNYPKMGKELEVSRQQQVQEEVWPEASETQTQEWNPLIVIWVRISELQASLQHTSLTSLVLLTGNECIFQSR